MVLDPASAMHEFEPDYVIPARNEGAAGFPAPPEDVDRVPARELARWKAPWDMIARCSTGISPDICADQEDQARP